MLISDEYAKEIYSDMGYISEDNDTDVINNIKRHAEIVINYLNNGGANLDRENLSPYELGIISNGVNDLIDKTSGGTAFSPAFEALAMQLCTKGGV